MKWHLGHRLRVLEREVQGQVRGKALPETLDESKWPRGHFDDSALLTQCGTRQLVRDGMVGCVLHEEEGASCVCDEDVAAEWGM